MIPHDLTLALKNLGWQDFFIFRKNSNAHQGCVYLIKIQ